jgi:hypothetical protein
MVKRSLAVLQSWRSGLGEGEKDSVEMRQSAHSGAGASTGKWTGGSGQVAAECVRALCVKLDAKSRLSMFLSCRFSSGSRGEQEERLPRCGFSSKRVAGDGQRQRHRAERLLHGQSALGMRSIT